ncbi:alpha/beta hydrolase [Flavicella sediminum]|uniref:alpha/beta hydrolase n=1 Tax=Flavicella sediminum TaxID=2585141 RepID=UPI001123039F|nr:alpha/beta hydrolase [Flavicella sediminum]
MKFIRTYCILLFVLSLSIGVDAQEKNIKKITSENLPALKNILENHPEMDTNKDAILTEGEYRAFQHKRDYKKHEQAFKGYYNYISDINYAGNTNKAQSLDIMIPENRKGKKLPVIVFIHGGGWKNGDKAIGLGILDPFIASGEFIGVTINYRLSREAKWPAQIHDCKAALRWLRGNAKTFGIDKDKIAVWGFSAGGHLSAMLAVSSNHKELVGKLGKHRKESSTVTCALFGAGPTDFLMKKSVSIIPEMVDNGFRGSAHNVFNLLDDGSAIKEKARKASPIYLIDKKTKPVFVYHGTKDPLVNMEHSESFIRMCKEKGATDYYLTKVEGLKHESKMPSDLKDRITSFLQKYLLDKEIEVGQGAVSIDQ